MSKFAKNSNSPLYSAYPSTATYWISIDKANQSTVKLGKHLILMPTYLRSCQIELEEFRIRKNKKFYGDYTSCEELIFIEKAYIHAIDNLKACMTKLNITPENNLVVHSFDTTSQSDKEFSKCEILRQLADEKSIFEQN